MEKIAESRYRLKQLILLIADEMREADFFGVTKLNKVLFRSEMASYRDLGHKLTTFHYQKNEMGPTLRAFLPVTREMESEGLLAWEVRPQGKRDERRPIALRKADQEVFEEDELTLVREEIRRALHLTARQVSDEEHATACWYATRMGENIKPELALVEDPGTSIPLSHDEEQRARRVIEGFLASNPTFPRARS